MDNRITKKSENITQVLRIHKMKGHNIIKRACMHNLREIPAELRKENIDSSRTYLNQILYGPSNSSVAKIEYEQMLASANLLRTIRKDAVMGIEIVVSLPRTHNIDEDKLFGSSIDWCKKYFGAPLLSGVIHRDEDHPHCHIIIVPIVNSRLQGSQLCGNRTKWRSMQENFYKTVGVFYGLTKPRPAVRYRSEYRALLATRVVDSIASNEGCLYRQALRRELIQVVANDPVDLAFIVGIDMRYSQASACKT